MRKHEVVGERGRRNCRLIRAGEAIFDFKGQIPVDWPTQVYPAFSEVAQLTKPWRWHKAGNADLANWLEIIRRTLEAGRPLDLRSVPACVTGEWLRDQDGPKRKKGTAQFGELINLGLRLGASGGERRFLELFELLDVMIA